VKSDLAIYDIPTGHNTTLTGEK